MKHLNAELVTKARECLAQSEKIGNTFKGIRGAIPELRYDYDGRGNINFNTIIQRNQEFIQSVNDELATLDEYIKECYSQIYKLNAQIAGEEQNIQRCEQDLQIQTAEQQALTEKAEKFKTLQDSFHVIQDACKAHLEEMRAEEARNAAEQQQRIAAERQGIADERLSSIETEIQKLEKQNLKLGAGLEQIEHLSEDQKTTAQAVQRIFNHMSSWTSTAPITTVKDFLEVADLTYAFAETKAEKETSEIIYHALVEEGVLDGYGEISETYTKVKKSEKIKMQKEMEEKVKSALTKLSETYTRKGINVMSFEWKVNSILMKKKNLRHLIGDKLLINLREGKLPRLSPGLRHYFDYSEIPNSSINHLCRLAENIGVKRGYKDDNIVPNYIRAGIYALDYLQNASPEIKLVILAKPKVGSGGQDNSQKIAANNAKIQRLKSQLARLSGSTAAAEVPSSQFSGPAEDRQRSAVAFSPQNIQRLRDTVHQQRQEDLETSTISQLEEKLNLSRKKMEALHHLN